MPGRSLQCEFVYSESPLECFASMLPIAILLMTSSFIRFHPPTVLCGDFNAVFDRSTDRRGSVVDDTSREISLALSRLFDACCVLDIWRYLHPSSSGSTWTRWDGSLSSRIDLFGCPYS